MAAHDDPIEMARSLAELKNEDGEIATPKDAYLNVGVRIYGLALVWL